MRRLEQVRRVLERRRDDLLRECEGAVGVGIGQAAGSEQATIVAYLRSERTVPEGPVSIDGVPIKFVVTGEFEAQ